MAREYPSDHKSIDNTSIEKFEVVPDSGIELPEILQHYSSEELRALEKKLVRRIDLRSLPILAILFLLNILDRNAIANARLGGLEATLGISDVQYQTAVMVLWAGYISMMVPSNMVLSIIKPRIYLPTVVIVWGIVSGATGFVQNFNGLVALRFMVGVTEAPYFPGCIFFLSCWYKRSELPARIATFYSGYTLSSAFGGLIAAGVVDGMEGLGGYESWRWIFILEGILTIVLAFLGYVLLPNYPSNTTWLSPEERALAQWRLNTEVDGENDEVNESVFVGLKQAFADRKVYLLIFIQTTATMSMSFTYFFPSIVKTLGFPRVETLLLTAPPYFLAFLFSIANSWHSGRTNERCFHIVIACVISACGQITSMSTHNTGARYFAMFLQAMGSFSAFQIILSWVSATIPRPKAKRAVTLALCTAVANATNISSAYLYPSWDAPLYRMGCIVLTVALVCCASGSLALRFWLRRLNRRADQATGLEGIENGTGNMFRYIL
ncbi:retrograde regulation protein 2 [Dothidotthia symphoricarpi CBS 119687]|uniref:Retrograde regulation protein 2 n=1 Tax=Dothidotthia symphoricarpi CBS 119687 TaxID=1392245 RepID=A0A6A6AAL7_9PLEO|nr:retrograde regulation protein 2 [Dothidotthia symphoricarpi CBS 119687]KAF2128263.1 retrograde regulation protein 2 [Dothidotthia symphoricarpi CBS 119687]